MYSKSTATITSILEAAQRLFLQKNYADVTMGEIAQAARVTKGALYHHFRSKRALGHAVVTELLGGHIQQFARTLEAAPDPIAALRGWLGANGGARA